MPIAFHSQALKGSALALSTYEKEFLTLITVVKKWRPYLVGKAFVIKTDQTKSQVSITSENRYNSSTKMVV